MKDEEIKEKCETCRFWREISAEEYDNIDRLNAASGVSADQCRKKAPPWQKTYSDDWCGDYYSAEVYRMDSKVFND